MCQYAKINCNTLVKADAKLIMAGKEKTTDVGFQDDFDVCKKDAEQQFEDIVDSAKVKLEEIKHAVATRLEEARKNDSPKKDLEKIVSENVDVIKSLEKDTIQTLNTSWNESKARLQKIYNSSTTALGNTFIFDNFKLLLNLLDETQKKYIDIVHKISHEAIKQVKSMPKERRTSHGSTSIQKI